MKIELKPFQEKASLDMREHIESAWLDIRHGHLQAIILSSPTGSGKTATVTALMEWLYNGYESYPADRLSGYIPFRRRLDAHRIDRRAEQLLIPGIDLIFRRHPDAHAFARPYKDSASS